MRQRSSWSEPEIQPAVTARSSRLIGERSRSSVGGPSLIDFDFEQLRGATILAVKGSIFNIPWADAGFGMDMVRSQMARAAGGRPAACLLGGA